MNNIIIKKDKSSIFISIVFLIIGTFLFFYPNDMVKFITYIIGTVFAVFGSIKLYTYYKNKQTVNNASLTLGITAIIIGIIIMFCNAIIELALRVLMGGFILGNGINKLIIALNSKPYNKNWKGLIIIASILIIGGLYIILKSNIILQAIGIILIIYSIIDITSYLLYPKNKNII